MVPAQPASEPPDDAQPQGIEFPLPRPDLRVDGVLFAQPKDAGPFQGEPDSEPIAPLYEATIQMQYRGAHVMLFF